MYSPTLTFKMNDDRFDYFAYVCVDKLHDSYSYYYVSVFSPLALWNNTEGDDQQSNNTDTRHQNQHQQFTCTGSVKEHLITGSFFTLRAAHLIGKEN